MAGIGLDSFALDNNGNVVLRQASTPFGPDTQIGMTTFSWASSSRNQSTQEQISTSWLGALLSGAAQTGAAQQALPSLPYSGGVRPAARRQDAYGLDAAVAEWGNSFQGSTLPRWEWDWEQERQAVQAAQAEHERAVYAAVARQAAMFNDYAVHPSYYVRDAQGIRLRGAYNPDMGPALR